MGTNDENTGDILEKTSVVTSETFKKGMSEADKAPPVVVILIGPTGYVGKQYPIATNEVIMGRSVECGIFVDDRSLSRSHAKFVVTQGEVFIVDLGSTNKTIVNGGFVQPLVPVKLNNNDQIKTGNVIFKFLEQGSIEAITNQAMYEKSQKDALTGAFSKGALIERGPEAIKRAEYLNEPMSLVTFDIDHFKKVNDNYGHPGGDYVLRELSRMLQAKVLRSNDFFARYGGEEFVVLLNSTKLLVAMEIAERIRASVESHSFVFEGRTIPVTVSVGVAEKLPNDTNWSSVYERADRALYASKQNGRNKVTKDAS
jgi:diguanylate cyclase (GGDEF)-like protein